MKKLTTPELSNLGGPIESYLSADHLGALNPELCMTGIALNNLADCLNIEIHNLVKRINLYEFARDAKKNNRNLDYKDDIDIAAKELVKRILRAPMPIANNPDMLDAVRQANTIYDLISEIQKDPVLKEFDLNNVYSGSEKNIRVNFVIDALGIFSSCSEKASQTRGAREYGKLIFLLIQMCYEHAGIDLSDKSISRDISDAKKRK